MLSDGMTSLKRETHVMFLKIKSYDLKCVLWYTLTIDSRSPVVECVIHALLTCYTRADSLMIAGLESKLNHLLRNVHSSIINYITVTLLMC